MDKRNFTDNIQISAIVSNLNINNGQLKYALCGKIITSKSEFHFDHILSYSKGGQSTLNNCQILCTECNLSKSDKEWNDFILEEKAKAIMTDKVINFDSASENNFLSANTKITKETFDKIIKQYIEKHNNIKKIDFTRDKNKLPSITYVKKFYGSMEKLKLAFGIKADTVWDRENIWEKLVDYSEINPKFKQTDLVKKNGIPSLPCILLHYPEYKNFSDIKKALGLDLNYTLWSKDRVIDACNEYLKVHEKITQKDLRKENGLPTAKVIYNYFGDMKNFQKEIKSKVSKQTEYISKDKIIETTKQIISENGLVFESRESFKKLFPYSLDVIIKRYGSFEAFVKDVNIIIINTKKAKYTKQEVDNLIITYLKSGNSIPSNAKKLSSFKLPSYSTILRFYNDWKEPFYLYSRIINIIN